MPLQRIYPRALLVPPGIPDFMSRERTVERGAHTITGRAWSGHAPVASVEVSVDGGATWEPAALDGDSLGEWAWRGFSYQWQATDPGRRSSAAGHATKPATSSRPRRPWNVGGYANNAVQRVVVNVR